LRRWLFVLGVSPDKTESEYGWIQPGAQLGRMNGHSVRAVQAFVEKPDAATAATAPAQRLPNHEMVLKLNASNGFYRIQAATNPLAWSSIFTLLSTSGMVEYARNSGANEFLVVTECGLSDRLTLELPEKKFYRACKLCHFMKMITLTDTLNALRETRHEIRLDEAVRLGAEKALQRMLELS
jgi:hypothetical protein